MRKLLLILALSSTACGTVEAEYDFIRASVIRFVNLTRGDMPTSVVETAVEDFEEAYTGAKEQIEGVEVVFQEKVYGNNGEEVGGIMHYNQWRAYVQFMEGFCIYQTSFFHELNHARLDSLGEYGNHDHSHPSWENIHQMNIRFRRERCHEDL